MVCELPAGGGKVVRAGVDGDKLQFWIIGPTTSWFIRLSHELFRDGIRSGVFEGRSDHGKKRMLTLFICGNLTKIRVHHPLSNAGMVATVDTQQLATAVEQAVAELSGLGVGIGG